MRADFCNSVLAAVVVLSVVCAHADDDWEAKRAALKNRPRPLILNSDGNEVVYWKTNLPVTVGNFTAQRLEIYRGSTVSTVAYCPWSSGFGLMTTTRAGEFFDIPRCLPELRPECHNAAPIMKAMGLDCLDMTADYCRTNGMEVFVSIRVNDTHDTSYFIPGTNPPRSYCFPKWKDAHPECLFGSQSKKPPFCAWSAVDFENPVVRDYMKGFVRDFVENYDVDGIEYDFFRHGQLFKTVGWGAYATEAQLKLMTEFMLELRTITEAAGRKKGRPILVLVRTSDSLAYAKAQGIDVETWLRRGVMDIWSVADYFQLDYLKPNAELAHRYGVKFNSALAESRIPGVFSHLKKTNKRYTRAIMLPGRNTVASYAAEYSAAMAAGCDGISSFNLSCTGGINARGLLDVDPRRTKDLDKVYFALVRGSGGYRPESWVKDGSRFYVRPRIDPATIFKIPTGKPYVFGIEFGDEEWANFDVVAKAALAGGQEVVTELKVNGRPIAPGAFESGVHTFPLKPGDLRKGYNEFSVTVDPKFGKELTFHDFAVYLRRASVVGTVAKPAATAGVAAMDAKLSADGLIRFAQGAAYYAIKPMLFLPGWKGAQSCGGYEIKSPGVATYRLEEGGEVLADATTTLRQLDDGKAKAVFTITPRKDVETISFGCTASFPIAEVDGKPWGIDGKKGMFAKPERGFILAMAKTAFAEFPSGVNGAQIRIEAPAPLDCLIQDDRKWGKTYSIRIGDLSTRTLKAGEPHSFEFVISSEAPVVAVDQRPYVIEAGKDWIPISEHRDILEGSALDFSKAGFIDAPAGKYGWLRNVGGHFEFERLPGRTQRFYGVNLCGTANFPDHALADTLVTRLRRFGYNALRLHHHDPGTVEGSADGVTLNPENMDRFDYLVAAAIREGIYLTTDMFVSRSHVMKWRHIGVDRDGLVDMQLFKALCAVYDPAFENWAAYAKNFMEHKNKYTGRRYADEPALSLVSLVNEGGFFMGWTRGVSDDPRVVASWRAWMKAKREADPSFAEGVDGEALPKSYRDRKTRPFVDQWCAELETKMVARMKAFLRSLGVKALVTNDNCGPHYVAKNGLAADYDYIDDHFYVDHPSFLEKSWRLPSRCPNVNPLLGKNPVVPVESEFPVVKGKPLTVTEWNFSGPGRYRGVGGILTGATAALKNMDGLWRFAYSHSRDRLGDSDIRPLSYFDLASDQLSLASDRASFCLFLRRDIGPGEDAALKMDRARGSFTIDTPRTVGGFAPEGPIKAGNLEATIVGAPATVCVHSLDGEPVAKSRRMLLTHLTDVQGEGERFVDESMTVLIKWGTRPLAQNGSAEISLALDSPARYEVRELAANGARLRVVKSSVLDGRLRFTATVSGPDGARMLYEIFAK